MKKSPLVAALKNAGDDYALEKNEKGINPMENYNSDIIYRERNDGIEYTYKRIVYKFLLEWKNERELSLLFESIKQKGNIPITETLHE